MARKDLVFLSYVMNCTQNELETTNALIQLARGEKLPTGAEVIIAECIADPIIAAKFDELTKKRAEQSNPAREHNHHKGKTREQITADVKARREAENAGRKQRKRRSRATATI